MGLRELDIEGAPFGEDTAREPIRYGEFQRKYSSPSEVSPWHHNLSGPIGWYARRKHAERTEASKEADESFNAPIAESYAQWAASPNRYDLPGVDTIPGRRLTPRAEEFLQNALDVGAVKQVVEEQPEDEYARGGAYRRSERALKLNAEIPDEADYSRETRAFTVAHEAGHALDWQAGEVNRKQVVEEGGDKYRTGMTMSEEVLGATDIWGALEDDRAGLRETDPELADEFKALSEKARGTIDPDDDIYYRERVGEVAADAIALSVLEPRATRRDYPRAYQAVQSRFFGNFERLEPSEEV